MPGLSGTEFFQRLWSENSNIPVIPAPGTLPRDAGKFPVAATLRKPLLPEQLMKTVREDLRADDRARQI